MSLFEAEDHRLEKLRELRSKGIDPYGGCFPDTLSIGRLVREFASLEGREVRAAGRITNLRRMGRATFLDIADWTGSIQVFFRINELGQEGWQVHQQLEAGDLIGVEGKVGKTRTGETTIFVSGFRVLCKALLSPPEKWHGLRDTEKRYRRRYVDLYTNADVMECFLKRSRIIEATRGFLRERGFVEVETPMMQPIPGGAAARPFVTHHNALDMTLYLRIAPELYLKRLLVGGMERVFEINRNFRNEGISTVHNPEFSMLELYQAYADYGVMMDLTEELIVHLAEEVCGTLALPFGEREVNLKPPWPRRTFWALMEEHAGIANGDEKRLREEASELDISEYHEAHPDWLAGQIFGKRVEKELAGPLFVKDYPLRLCPLTRAKRDEPEIAERFELYIAGLECANAYTELNDAQEQAERFHLQVGEQELRERVDKDFLRALAYGMPPAGGLGIGIDRLVMLLTNRTSIREVILFPLLRPEEG